MDGEPPAKRARRTDSAAMWDKSTVDGTGSPRSAPTTDRDPRVKKEHEGSRAVVRDSRRDDDRRRRSRSPRDKRDINRRSRSPRDRDRGYRDRDRERGTAYDKDGERSRSRSRDRYRSNRDQKPSRKRSRSPIRNGTSTPSSRPRSPNSSTRPRPKLEDRDVKPPLRDIKPSYHHKQTNGSTSSPKPNIEPGMDVDIDGDETADLENAMKRMMGFSTFKSTHNTKVPGNQIYGVRKEKKTEYRQYMNRVGGFNRPLSPGK